MTLKYKLLDKFKPSKLDRETITAEFKVWLTERGIKGTVDHPHQLVVAVKTPSETTNMATGPYKVALEWHRDGLQDVTNTDPLLVPVARWFMSWTNSTPTGVRHLPSSEHGSREITVAEPYDVQIFNNRMMQHRCPPEQLEDDNRWLIRLLDPILPKGVM